MAIPEYVAKLRSVVGHELLCLPSVSAVVVNDAGEILVGQRSDNLTWSVISGFVEPGEQPAEALVREVYEETGVHVVPERVTGIRSHPFVYPNGDACEYLNIAFRCRPVGGTARVNDDESLAVGWFAPADLPELDEHGTICLEHALAPDTGAWFVAPPDPRA